MRTYLLLLLLGPLACLFCPASAAADEVQWHYEYNAARKEAESRGLPLMLDFGTPNCAWCKKLDETTFSDPAVIKTLNEKFIPLKIDGDRDQALTQALRIASYPTLVLAAADGKILSFMEGFQDVGPLQENLQRVLSNLSNPDWMQRDYQLAVKAAGKNEHFRAVALLKPVLEEGRGRPIHAQAEKLLQDVESTAKSRLAKAKQLQEKGQSTEARDALNELIRDFAGTQTSREAMELTAALTKDSDQRVLVRQRRAKELLARAREDFNQKQFLACLERCELLGASYGDLAEGVEAIMLANEIKGNTEWVRGACESLSNQLNTLLLTMAENWMRQGQTEQAVVCLERIIRIAPSSRQAEQAQIRLNQIHGPTTQRVEFQK